LKIQTGSPCCLIGCVPIYFLCWMQEPVLLPPQPHFKCLFSRFSKGSFSVVLLYSKNFLAPSPERCSRRTRNCSTMYKLALFAVESKKRNRSDVVTFSRVRFDNNKAFTCLLNSLLNCQPSQTLTSSPISASLRQPI
jgi:hypothetical protein